MNTNQEPPAVAVRCAHDEMRDVVGLVAHPKNPNTHPREQIELLARIIRYQGWRNPIVVSKLSGYIIAGHGRLEAAKLMGEQQAPVDLQDFETEADELAHLAADNRLAELAGGDDDQDGLAAIAGRTRC